METKVFRFSGRGMEEISLPNLEIGQIVWLNGYGQSKHDHERKAIYAIEENKYGRYYKAVNLDNPARVTFEAFSIRHESRIFGIGIYYTDGDFASPDEIVDALSLANQKEAALREYTEIVKNERDEAIDRGKKIVAANLPEGAASVIVAEYMVDESDPMTDYFNSRASSKIILAFSLHKKDLFSEMRKAALKSDNPEIRELATASKDFEHREKWSMGAGYYLGKSKYSGWIIRKGWMTVLSDEVYELVGRGDCCAF